MTTHACGTQWRSWLNATTRFLNLTTLSLLYHPMPTSGAAVLWKMALPPIFGPPRACLLLGLSSQAHLLPSCFETPRSQPLLICPTQASLAPAHVGDCSHILLLLPLPRERDLGHRAAVQQHLSPPTPLLPRPPCPTLTCQNQAGQPRISCHNFPLPCFSSSGLSRQAKPSYSVPGFDYPYCN